MLTVYIVSAYWAGWLGFILLTKVVLVATGDRTSGSSDKSLKTNFRESAGQHFLVRRGLVLNNRHFWFLREKNWKTNMSANVEKKVPFQNNDLSVKLQNHYVNELNSNFVYHLIEICFAQIICLIRTHF